MSKHNCNLKLLIFKLLFQTIPTLPLQQIAAAILISLHYQGMASRTIVQVCASGRFCFAGARYWALEFIYGEKTQRGIQHWFSIKFGQQRSS
jgi:rhodanese-related sulfurtransferase